MFHTFRYITRSCTSDTLNRKTNTHIMRRRDAHRKWGNKRVNGNRNYSAILVRVVTIGVTQIVSFFATIRGHVIFLILFLLFVYRH
jgi:hypothetical protein